MLAWFLFGSQSIECNIVAARVPAACSVSFYFTITLKNQGLCTFTHFIEP